MKSCRTRTFVSILLSVVIQGVPLQIAAQVDEVAITWEKVSERILLVRGGEVYRDQVAAVATENGIVIIDAGKSPTLTARYRSIIERELGRNDFTYVINTHYHFDHTGGNQVFPEAIIIAHEKTPELMKQWAAHRPEFVTERRHNQMVRWHKEMEDAEPGTEAWIRLKDIVTTGEVMLDDYEHHYSLTLPAVTFSDRLSLYLGDITLSLFYFGEGLHTGDDIVILCPEEKALFSGDLFYKGYFGFAFSPAFDAERWISVLDEIFEGVHEIEWVYDCHNGRMPGTYVALYHRYLKDVWNTLLAAKEEGMDGDAVLEMYGFEKRFSYIRESGLSDDVLARGHENNLKFTWQRIAGAADAAR